MLHVLHCKKCTKSTLPLDAVTAHITLRRTEFCGECRHRHEKKSEYYFCSVQCMMEWLADNPETLEKHSEGMKSEPHWPWRNVDGVMKNVLVDGG